VVKFSLSSLNIESNKSLLKCITQMSPRLKVKDLSCRRSNEIIFSDINFEVISGENLEIIGSNGSGKTTLLRAVLGLIALNSGEVNWPIPGNEETSKIRHMAFYQGHKVAIKNLLTAKENLELFYPKKNLKREEMSNLLARVGVKDVNRLAGNLSEGQRKRVALARWFVKKSSFYLIDEPFSAMDNNGIELVKDFISELNKEGASFLITGHGESGIRAKQLNLDIT